MKFLTLPLLLVSLPLSHADTQFNIASSSLSCDGPFNVKSVEVTCDDSLCTWGSNVFLDGLVDLESNLGESGTVTATAMNGNYPLYSGDFAPCGCMTSMDDNTACPNMGSYAFTYDYPIPGKPSWWGLVSHFNVAIGIEAIFNFEGSASTTCTMTFTATQMTATQAQAYQMVSTVGFVGGAILFVGVAAIGLYKKRRVATIQLQEDEGTRSHFEMMPNDAAVGV